MADALKKIVGLRIRWPTSRLPGFSKQATSPSMQSHPVSNLMVSQQAPKSRSDLHIRRLHSASAAAVTIGTTILEDQEFVSSFITKARQSLALRYRITTSTFDRAGIRYIKGG